MAVSTRAPREGDDTDTWLRTVGLATISIHVPREGDDSTLDLSSCNQAISIHVPREGDDLVLLV